MGYRNSYKSAFKHFIFTHAGAVFVLLGIGAIYWLTAYTDMLPSPSSMATVAPDVIKWYLSP
jgi:formate hydrogenlyase subunit 3/multisubunit Na+/H+ antiporter MnhD subunit